MQPSYQLGGSATSMMLLSCRQQLLLQVDNASSTMPSVTSLLVEPSGVQPTHPGGAAVAAAVSVHLTSCIISTVACQDPGSMHAAMLLSCGCEGSSLPTHALRNQQVGSFSLTASQAYMHKESCSTTSKTLAVWLSCRLVAMASYSCLPGVPGSNSSTLKQHHS